MPKFIYVKNFFGGVSSVILFEEITNGSGVPKEQEVVQEHSIKTSDALKGIKHLETMYPLTVKLEEGE